MEKIPALLETASRCHQNGDMAAAEQQYLEILGLDPQNGQALYQLGTLKAQAGDVAVAQRYLEQATHHAPAFSPAWVNLGNVLQQLDKPDRAAACYQQALTIDETNAEACFGLGRLFFKSGNDAQARDYFLRALSCRPEYAQACFNLGRILRRQGDLQAALARYEETLRLAPQMQQVYSELGGTLLRLGRPDEALTAYLQYVQARPDAADGWNNLGLVQRRLARMDEAADSFRRALQLDPSLAEASNNLGSVLKTLGQPNEALACYRRALELRPGFAQAHSNLLMCLNYIPGIDEAQVYAEHIRWAAQYSPAPDGHVQHDNTADPQRRLRIGYMSPDFRKHAVTCLFEPLLANHDADVVETSLYAQVARGDDTTRRLQSLASDWCCTVGMSYEQLAARIRQDRIDILVDLAGHSARSRLAVMRLHPAPIRVSWLGYPNTTGMSMVDYRLTDAIADPAGAGALYTEKLVRLENGLSCYQPPAHAPDSGPLPALQESKVTFGSLNNPVKLNQAVIELWSRVLQQTPGSRLLLFRDMLQGSMAERIRAAFAEHSIRGEQLELLHSLPDGCDYLSVYQSIDICLDPFPWNGHITTCEALWMGVPVITLRGHVHRGRLAASVLHQVGLNNLVADSEGDYVRIASGLASDLDSLSNLRRRLRQQLKESVLCDGASYARAVESFYRKSWHSWCAGVAPES